MTRTDVATQQEHFDASRKFQAYYDETLRNIGMRAPQPVLGQTCNDYRRETLRTIKRTFLPQNHELYQVQMRRLPADILPGLNPSFYLLPSLRPTIPHMSLPANCARSNGLMSTES
jgi:hypothetical protein